MARGFLTQRHCCLSTEAECTKRHPVGDDLVCSDGSYAVRKILQLNFEAMEKLQVSAKPREILPTKPIARERGVPALTRGARTCAKRQIASIQTSITAP